MFGVFAYKLYLRATQVTDSFTPFNISFQRFWSETKQSGFSVNWKTDSFRQINHSFIYNVIYCAYNTIRVACKRIITSYAFYNTWIDRSFAFHFCILITIFMPMNVSIEHERADFSISFVFVCGTPDWFIFINIHFSLTRARWTIYFDKKKITAQLERSLLARDQLRNQCIHVITAIASSLRICDRKDRLEKCDLQKSANRKIKLKNVITNCCDCHRIGRPKNMQRHAARRPNEKKIAVSRRLLLLLLHTCEIYLH